MKRNRATQHSRTHLNAKAALRRVFFLEGKEQLCTFAGGAATTFVAGAGSVSELLSESLDMPANAEALNGRSSSSSRLSRRAEE